MNFKIKDFVIITINNIDITDKVIGYRRDQDICTGVGTLNLRLIDDGTDYSPWDIIEIYERTYEFGPLRLAGYFYAVKCEKNKKDGTYIINAKDCRILLLIIQKQ